MLTNILNIVGLTASMGMSIAKSNNQPKRDIITNNVNITLNADTTVIQNNPIDANNRYQASSTYFSNYNSQISIEMLRIGLETQLNNGEKILYSNTNDGNTPLDKVEYGNVGEITTTQQMWYIKITPTNYIRDGKLTINNRYGNESGLTQENRVYTEILFARRQSLEEYFNDNTWGFYFKNNSLYQKFNEIFYTQTGYTSIYKQENYDPELQIGTTINFEEEYEVNLVQNRVNYIVIYQQFYNRNITQDYNESYLRYSGNDQIEFTGIEAINPSNQEVVDLPGIMFTVLGMPFTFISTAFNLTLFPGTPYEVNISLLFLAIFAVIVFVFLIKLILGKVR